MLSGNWNTVMTYNEFNEGQEATNSLVLGFLGVRRHVVVRGNITLLDVTLVPHVLVQVVGLADSRHHLFGVD